MKFVVEKLFVNSKKSTELIRITDKVRRTVQMTGLKEWDSERVYITYDYRNHN